MAKRKKYGRKDRDGVRLTKTINGIKKEFYGDTKEEAQAKLDAWVKKMSPSNYRDMTLEEWSDAWLTTVKADIGDSQKNNLASVCKIHINPILGHKKIVDIETPDIMELMENRRKYKVCKKKNPSKEDMEKAEPLSQRQLAYIYTTINAMLEKARKLKMIAENPCEAVDKPQVKRKLPQPLKSEEVTVYLQQIAQHPLLYPLSIVALDSGCRSGELLSLTWSNVFLKQGFIQIIDGKTENAPRKLPLPIRSIEILQSLKKEYDKRKKEMGLKYFDYGLVFSKDNGTHYKNWEISKKFKSAALKAGIRDNAKFHNLRDTHATELLELGEHPFNVQERLGHATLQMTKDYSKVSGQHHTGLISKLEQNRSGQQNESGQ